MDTLSRFINPALGGQDPPPPTHMVWHMAQNISAPQSLCGSPTSTHTDIGFES